MNKKILALAVGSALAMPMMAQAKVVVYGHAQVEIGSIDNGTTDQTFSRDEARGRIGIKASEKLGNGMTAFAKFEFRTDTSDGDVGGQTLGAREHAIGLKGSFGTVELGRLKSPYKYMGGVTYDPFVATNLEARGNGGQSKTELHASGAYGHSGFLNNSIAWKSNNFNGISVWALVSFDEEATGLGGNQSAASDGDYSIGIKYNNGPLELGLAAINNDGGAGVDQDAVKLFGQYKFGNHKISASYEMLDLGTANSDHNVYFLGYQLRSGNNTFVAQLGNTEEDFAGGTDTDYYAIGMIHHLSKKTRLFGGFRNTDTNVTNGETDVFSVGIRMIF
jgi:predicted porin